VSKNGVPWRIFGLREEKEEANIEKIHREELSDTSRNTGRF
jgi:hypothetical protein